MIQILVFLAGPMIMAFVYFFFNLPSLINKSREFNRITEVLVLEQRIKQVVEAARVESPHDEQLESIGHQFLTSFRVDVIDQFNREAEYPGQTMEFEDWSRISDIGP
ncbi:hypothetical protein KR084_009070 [Drosophila pseudotakahashii]|nr:hypothetical protein KR084_009070 [Drosophila pseudotakahashii]